jgi:hypothetical protein
MIQQLRADSGGVFGQLFPHEDQRGMPRNQQRRSSQFNTQIISRGFSFG